MGVLYYDKIQAILRNTIIPHNQKHAESGDGAIGSTICIPAGTLQEGGKRRKKPTGTEISFAVFDLEQQGSRRVIVMLPYKGMGSEVLFGNPGCRLDAAPKLFRLADPAQ